MWFFYVLKGSIPFIKLYLIFFVSRDSLQYLTRTYNIRKMDSSKKTL